MAPNLLSPRRGEREGGGACEAGRSKSGPASFQALDEKEIREHARVGVGVERPVRRDEDRRDSDDSGRIRGQDLPPRLRATGGRVEALDLPDRSSAALNEEASIIG